MHMADCGVTRHSFITNFGSPATPNVEEYCPEYTLLSDNVVYLIVGKSSSQLIPLAQSIDFRLQKSELAVRVDDAKRESKFHHQGNDGPLRMGAQYSGIWKTE